jgi:two-component system cell cycle response regulator DivK
MARDNPYILLVDDSPDGREMLTEYLSFRGFDVVAVSTGESALAHTRSRHPAVVLMDLQMPGMTGWDATRQLKAHPETKDVIVVALTAHAMLGDEHIARQAGCDAFIPKPFDIIAVADAIGELVAHGRAGLAAVDALTPLTGKPQNARQTRRT